MFIAYTQCFYKLCLNLVHIYLNTHSELPARLKHRQKKWITCVYLFIYLFIFYLFIYLYTQRFLTKVTLETPGEVQYFCYL